MKLRPRICIVPDCNNEAEGLMCPGHWKPLPRELKQQLLDEKRGIERAGAKRSTPNMTRLVLRAARIASGR